MARAVLKDLLSKRFIGSIYNPGCAARVFTFFLQCTAEWALLELVCSLCVILRAFNLAGLSVPVSAGLYISLDPCDQ
jgi:hypothetical protein